MVKSSEEIKKYKQEWYKKNKDKITVKNQEKYKNLSEEEKQLKLQYIKEWQSKNIDKRKLSIKKYHQTHQDDEKMYYINNRDKIIIRVSNYQHKNRKQINKKIKIRRTNPIIKLQHSISVLVRFYINGVKNGSIMKYLPYTVNQLKQHLESQFESWMTWENWGRYNVKTWNDNDSSTWIWQIDHIIPQSKLLYLSMEDDNFKKCWALENLRPYSAKQNILDGAQLKRGNLLKNLINT